MHGLAIQGSGQGYGMPKHYGTGFSKDHFRENVRRMRQIQRKSREKEVESVQPVKALWKSEKYKDVPSKIKDDIEKVPDTPRPHSASFLRAHTRSGPSVKLQSRPCTPDPKLSVPPASIANDVQLVRHDFDFIKVNGRAVKHSHVPRAPSLTALDDLKKKQEDEFKKHKKGEVPTYLRTRKEQWKKEEEDRIANAPDPSCPEGHRVLPEAERRETLDLLKQKQQELISKLQSLPLRTDTFRMRSCKQELENKLAEMDEAIKIFSRPKVFVKAE
ncbi:enkurin domain-containing protein 1-like isoform X1 [Mercenaria mercenaria]|uniref:enkurin domain-containing protein 1-like isoform X1 n=1 Tax=Mercenaria mercenaria TaxID=6596 RepID=UPI00234E900B|nr:enkurin domain-containing protein 1-like isoform X1 [Mercenaria mercenaria]